MKRKSILLFGYFLRWCLKILLCSRNTGSKADRHGTAETYSKYNSLDDKIDGFFYYTRYIVKF
jgi:hypothetical protein